MPSPSDIGTSRHFALQYYVQKAIESSDQSDSAAKKVDSCFPQNPATHITSSRPARHAGMQLAFAGNNPVRDQ
jgi:hypothetical protein